MLQCNAAWRNRLLRFRQPAKESAMHCLELLSRRSTCGSCVSLFTAVNSGRTTKLCHMTLWESNDQDLERFARFRREHDAGLMPQAVSHSIHSIHRAVARRICWTPPIPSVRFVWTIFSLAPEQHGLTAMLPLRRISRRISQGFNITIGSTSYWR